ncbi:MAG: leucyl aminopeptidase, partial [Arenimonas sp.]|uniref:M17 family peptidase N-terminal domain-containing protein n=1 Tax=Arenimonas sp. TaxID=1872635 RepID=UPI0025BE2FA4
MALEFRLNHLAPATADTDCVVVGVFGDGSLSPSAQAINQASGGKLAALVERGDASGKTGRTTLLPDLECEKPPRVLVVGLNG